MGKSIQVARAKDEASSQLEGVFAQFVLRVAGSLGASASLGVVASQQVQQIGALEFHGIVRFTLFVNEQREGDPGLVAKSARVDAVTKPDGGQGSAAVLEGLLVSAQLRDVLAAKDSAVMAQENEHSRLAEP